MSERVMARVVKVDEVKTHPNADALDLALIGGWQCVVKRNEFKAGDLAIYMEVDSFVPTEVAPFLTKPGHFPKTYNGVDGERLKTIKLRGELSQGLLLPVQSGFGGYNFIRDPKNPDQTFNVNEGDDVSALLRVQKWEAPVSPQLAGQARGSFPSAFPKTDQERIQNLTRQFEDWKSKGLTFMMQEKLEGSSMTCYLLNGEFGVCSRNLDLKETEGNTFWQVARELDIENQMRAYFTEAGFGETDVAIQGELIGPGIQGNIYGLSKPTFRVFDIVMAKGQRFLEPNLVHSVAESLGLITVPYLYRVVFTDTTVQTVLESAEGKSEINPKQEREGLVFKCNEDPSISFKAISNKYLLGQKD